MILAIRYLERDYAKTVECIKAEGVPTVFVDRNPAGVGSLSEAINRGMQQIPDTERFVWIVTNIRFNPGTYSALWHACNDGLAAVCPSYLSDHSFLRPDKSMTGVLAGIPFIEFTAPMVRVDVMKRYLLDEDMPYVGQDLDWSHRVKMNGGTLGSHKGAFVGHQYIRQKLKAPITLQRLKMRKAADAKTTAKLVEKYGENWPDLMQYHSGIAVK